MLKHVKQRSKSKTVTLDRRNAIKPWDKEFPFLSLDFLLVSPFKFYTSQNFPTNTCHAW